MSACPPRLAHQPIVYPVTNATYAAQIARDWNTGDAAPEYVSCVTRSRARPVFLDRYTPRIGGGKQREEYWIAAEGLGSFNRTLAASQPRQEHFAFTSVE